MIYTEIPISDVDESIAMPCIEILTLAPVLILTHTPPIIRLIVVFTFKQMQICNQMSSAFLRKSEFGYSYTHLFVTPYKINGEHFQMFPKNI